MTIIKAMTENPAAVIRNMLTTLKPVPTGIVPETEFPGDIRGILFDIYGTLLISGTGDISLASVQRDTLDMEKILNETGFTSPCRDFGGRIPEILEQFILAQHKKLRLLDVQYPEVDIRDIWRKTLKLLWDEGILESNPSDKSVDLLALKHELSVNPVWPMPGFPEIITRLGEAGFILGIVSNAQFYTSLIIEALTGQSLEQLGFDLNLCAWSYELKMAKPSSEVFKGPLARLSNMGISPGQVLYVGNDMLNDVKAASAAGCKTVLFAGDKRSLRLREGNPLAAAKPDMIITELLQLELLLP